jgi:two-component system phosphate regulon sensor histidine kinase PhoR
MRMRIKISWKLALAFSIPTIFVFVVLYFYLNSHLNNYLENRIQETLKSDLSLCRAFIENETEFKNGLPDETGLAKRISASLGMRSTIISASGVVAGDSDLGKNDLARAENHINRPEIQAAIKNGFGASKRFSTTIKKSMLYVAVPIGRSGQDGFLRLAMPLSELEDAESGLRKIIIAAVFFMLILALILGYLISLLVSRPLIEMAQVARKLAKGDFSKKTFVHSSDEIGDLARAMNYMADEIKDKVNSLSSEKAKLGAVVSGMFEGVILTNEKGEIVLANPSIYKLFMVNSSAEGKAPIEMVHNTVIQDMVDRILKEKQRLTTKELVINVPEEKVIQINGVPVIEKGKLEGAILVFHDITELRALERVRQDFVANVSHELRTPISSIKGYAETLLEGALNDKDNAKDFVEIIYRDSERLAQLIDDILDLSKIESDKMKIALLATDVKGVLERSIAIMAKQAKAKSIDMKLELGTSLPKILADESRLSQVLINLLDNAIKYTKEGGAITVLARSKDKYVQIDISDTGIGIPEEDIARIFERFYRVDKARSRELGGTGLGLSIVKHIVQAHGGEVWVKSVVGQGSTFSFSIPRIK